MPMFAAPTYDYETDQADILRRQKIAEAMMAGGLAPMGPTETAAGGYAVKRSPLEGIAKIVQAVMGAKQMEKLTGEQQQLGQRYRQDLSSGLDRFLTGLEGGQATIPGGAGTDAYGGQVDYKPDPRRAVLEAMGSNHPALQQIGGSYLQSMLKKKEDDGIKPKDVLPYADPATIPALASQGMSGFKPKKEKPLEVDGMLLDRDTLEVLEAKGAKPTQITINGDLYERNPTTNRYRKLDNAPKVSVTTNSRTFVNAGQKAGIEAWAKSAAATVEELSKSARESTKLITQLSTLERLSQGGTNAGPLADTQTFVQGLANAAGIPVDKAKLNNSQAFNSVATQAWAALMQQNGGARGLVKEESEKLAQSLPSLLQTPQGRAQITAVLKQQAEANIKDAMKANQQLGEAIRSEDPAKFTYGLSATMMPQSSPMQPAPGAVAPGSAPISLDEYIKSRKGR